MYKEKYLKYKIKYLNLKNIFDQNIENKFLKYKAKYIAVNTNNVISYNESTAHDSKNFFELIKENYRFISYGPQHYDIALLNFEIYKDQIAIYTNAMTVSNNTDLINYYLNLYYKSWAKFINQLYGINHKLIEFTIPEVISTPDITTELRNHVYNKVVVLPTNSRSLSEQIHVRDFNRLVCNRLLNILNHYNTQIFENIFHFELKLKISVSDMFVVEFTSADVIGHFTFHVYDQSKSTKTARTCHLVHESDPKNPGLVIRKKNYNLLILDNNVNYIVDIDDDVNMIPVVFLFVTALNLLINQPSNTMTLAPR